VNLSRRNDLDPCRARGDRVERVPCVQATHLPPQQLTHRTDREHPDVERLEGALSTVLESNCAGSASKLAIDDFGTGYTSRWSYLSTLPID
jgi:sensor c-di-GMP phosphodiesterase-like protein